MTGPGPLVALQDAWKGYGDGESRVDILRGVSLEVRCGESLAIMGPSGAGKSTLLHLMGLLTPPDRGRLLFEGEPVAGLPGARVRAIRTRIGFVFQDAKLIPDLSVEENVCVPLLHRGVRPRRQRVLARAALEQVGLGGRCRHRPCELSGGELMRVSIARALVAAPDLVLADEPTGALDSVTGAQIADLLLGVVSERCAVVLATHQASLAGRAGRVMVLRDGVFSAPAERAFPCL